MKPDDDGKKDVEEAPAKKRADSDDDSKSADSSDKLPAAKVVAGDAGESSPPESKKSLAELGGELAFPDDGPLAKKLRQVDNAVGRVEQVGLVALLALVVIVAATHAIMDKAFGARLELKGEIVRTGTFAIAIFGAVFATHQGRHLAMDLISRRFSPRNRLILKIFLALFAMFIVGLMAKAGLKSVEIEKSQASHSKLLSGEQIAWMIPIGGALMIFHFFVHTLIDIDYLLRGKTPPERMRSAH